MAATVLRHIGLKVESMDEINWTNKIFAQNSSFNHINTVTIWISVLDQRKGGSRREFTVTWWHRNFNADVTLQVARLFKARGVGGRLGHQHGFGRLAAPGQAGDSDMVGGGPPSPARAPHIIIHTYLTSQVTWIILHTYPNYPTYLLIYPTYPLHAYVADKQPR